MTHYYPIPTVRLIVPDPDNQVLILKRALSEYGEGCWCLPGGKVDYGMTVHDTVKKELFEETTLICNEAQFLFYQDSLPMAAGAMHCINLYFLCRVSGAVRLNQESSEFAWIGPTELDRYAITFRNDWALKQFWSRE